MKRISHLGIPSDAVLVDVRDELDAVATPLPSSSACPVILAPFGDLEAGMPLEWPLDAPLVVVCGTGQRSELAGAYLLADGAREVLILEGGLRAWRRALETPALEQVDLNV